MAVIGENVVSLPLSTVRWLSCLCWGLGVCGKWRYANCLRGLYTSQQRRKEGRLELPRVSEKSADTRHPRQQRPSDLRRAISTAGHADGKSGPCLLRLGAQIAAVRGFGGSDEMQWSSTYVEKSWYGEGM